MNHQKNELITLGAWDVPPLKAWPWFSDIAIEKFARLTGIKFRAFTYLKNNLHVQCFFMEDTKKLYSLIESLNAKEQVAFVEKIVRDYFSEAKIVEEFIQKCETQINNKTEARFDVEECVDKIQSICEKSSYTTMQIWMAQVFDMIYPSLEDKKNLKEICAKARDHSGHLHERAKRIIDIYVGHLSKLLKISSQEVYYCFPEELKNVYELKKVIIERCKFFVTTNVMEDYKIFEGKKAKDLFNIYDDKTSIALGNNQKELIGQVAYKGKVSAKARVVLYHDQFAEFRDKEILVALQTMINYLPIMKKASAIITEYGGITSHAAIVSRELKIPCIVGIKGLTSNIKTGDEVEVDADKGIVRKI